MARNRCSKQKHTTRQERNACKTAQPVENNTTDDKTFSETLSRVLDYCAVNEHLIQLMRKINFSLEREITLINKAFGRNSKIYIFGSQIEGTTTTGMRSDRDTIHRYDMFRLFLETETTTVQPHHNQVLIKVRTSDCASQYCFLKMIEQEKRFEHFDSNRDAYDIVKCFRMFWSEINGWMPHTLIFEIKNQLSIRRPQKHGPAEHTWNTDNVYACYCKSLPKQCKFFFERPRPGHWPSEKTLKKVKNYGVFIVPQGPPKSTNICTYDYFDYQWRISTNLTERFLIFSLDTVHLKAYILTKMIRKELFAPEYRDRLSTFHFKTAFFFAVENTPPDLWREDNLINCSKYILGTLRRFLTRRNCPHFTIDNVNLFDGKFEIHEFPKLADKLAYIINSLRTKIAHIQMDNIGKALSERGTGQNELSIYLTDGSALFNYVFHMFHSMAYNYPGIEYSYIPVKVRKAVFESDITLFDTYYRAPLGKYKKYDYMLHGVMSTLASVGASAYLEQKAEGNEYSADGINKAKQMYTQSLESDSIGNYMQYASFLFCNEEYDAACKLFDLIETKIEQDKKSNLIYQFFISLSETVALKIAKQPYEQSFKQRLSLCLIFKQAEARCAPEFLRCEMYRGRIGTYTFTGFSGALYNYEDCICVQIEPYLYYLQYLTYRKLNKEPKQSEALMKLSKYTKTIKPARFSISNGDIVLSFAHFDTSLNMLGHCLELEQKLEWAWMAYTTSLRLLPWRNAAVLHIIRLLWQDVQSLWTEGDVNYTLEKTKRKCVPPCVL